MNTELNTEQRVHEPTADCEGHQVHQYSGRVTCCECDSPLCPCQLTYGHDCE